MCHISNHAIFLYIDSTAPLKRPIVLSRRRTRETVGVEQLQAAGPMSRDIDPWFFEQAGRVLARTFVPADPRHSSMPDVGTSGVCIVGRRFYIR